MTWPDKKEESLMPKPSIASRIEIIILLELYSRWLMDNGYLDTDWKDEPPFAIDEFMKFYDKYMGIKK